MYVDITCTRISVYQGALTRGRRYELLRLDEEKKQVRIRGDNQRIRWFPLECFDLFGGEAPVLVRWEYHGSVVDDRNCWDERDNLIDIYCELSNGEQRFLTFVTPDYLKNLLEPRSEPWRWTFAGEPGIYGKEIIVVRNVTDDTVDWMLRHLNDQGDLIEHSIRIEK